MKNRIIVGLLCTVLCTPTFAKWTVTQETDRQTGDAQFMCINVGISATAEDGNEYRLLSVVKPSLVVDMTPKMYFETNNTMMCEQCLIMMFNPCLVKDDIAKIKIAIDDGPQFVVDGETGNNRHGVFLPPSLIREIHRSKRVVIMFTDTFDHEIKVVFNTDGLNDAYSEVKKILKRTRPKSVVFKAD